jgi:hypothetical protein
MANTYWDYYSPRYFYWNSHTVDPNWRVYMDKYSHTDPNGSVTDSDYDTEFYGNGEHYIYFDANGNSHTVSNDANDSGRTRPDKGSGDTDADSSNPRFRLIGNSHCGNDCNCDEFYIDLSQPD